MAGEFETIVKGDRLDGQAASAKGFGGRSRQSSGLFRRQFNDQHILSASFDQRKQGPLVPLADDRVSLPVTHLRIGLYNRWPLVNTDAIRNQLPLARLTPFLVMLAVANAQILR